MNKIIVNVNILIIQFLTQVGDTEDQGFNLRSKFSKFIFFTSFCDVNMVVS